MIFSAAKFLRKAILGGAAISLLSACSGGNPHIMLNTDAGTIEIEVYSDKAPISAADFLYYVDNGLYNGEGFYRAVRPKNDPLKMDMQIVQGGRLDVNRVTAEIALERTSQTGLTHHDGAVSIARNGPDTGSAAYFFVSIGDNKFLDYGGARVADGQGFAVFGQVVKGMDVVRAIQAKETAGDSNDPLTDGQYLTQPVIIKSATRK